MPPSRLAGIIVLLALLAAVGLLPSVWAKGGIPWVMAGYAPVWNYSVLASLGFDAVYRHADWTFEKAVPGWHEKNLGLGSQVAASYNLTFIAGQYWQQPSWKFIDFNYSKAVNQNGHVEPYTPSPISEDWWRYMVEEPALFIANLSLYYPIWGIVWDMEYYYGDGSGEGKHFKPPSYSYDQAALDDFARETGSTIPFLPPDERYAWLKANGLLGQYVKWQENKTYSLARNVADEVHAINPNLTLGVLYFEDAWFHWRILEGFMTDEAPVTGWNEQTYAGYKLGGPEGVDTYRERWASHGLNGEFLPGIAAIPPWLQLTAIEEALRDNGHLWVYQQSADSPQFRTTFSFINKYFLFNGAGPNPLPRFDLIPGIDARPSLGPGGEVSLYLNTYQLGLDPPAGFTIITQASELEYAGSNLTVKKLEGPSPVLKAEDFPCIIYGLREEDLLPTETWALIQELDNILGFSANLELVELPAVGSALNQALEEFKAGEFETARSRLVAAREDAYLTITQQVWPLLEAGLANPRNTTIPLTLLRDISAARTCISEGRREEGRALLYGALGGWSLSVNQGVLWSAVMLLVFLALRQAPPGRPTQTSLGPHSSGPS